MKNKITGQRIGIQAGDVVTVYKHSTNANQIRVRRAGLGEAGNLIFEGSDVVSEDEVLIVNCSPHFSPIEFICRIAGLQAVKQTSNDMFDEYVLQPGESLFSDTINPEIYREEFEAINAALKKHRGRRRDAAAELGISERTLYRKSKELSQFFEFEA